jgi:peptide/nickel transport system permease protein
MSVAESAIASEPVLGRRPRVGRSFLACLLGNRAASLGLAIVVAIVLLGVSAPAVAPYGYDEDDLLQRLAPPVWATGGNWQHLLGTDPLGRDVLSRLIYGVRVSLGLAATAVIAAAGLGIVLGLMAGYYGGRLDALIMRVADAQLAFPYLLLAIAMMAVLRPSVTNLIFVLVVRSWVVYARLIRASTLSLKHREFIQASRALGARDGRVLFRHVAPNVLASAIVVSSFQLAELIIVETSLSFLGLGMPPPMPSWGSMLADGREYMSTAWWLATLPGLAIVVTVLGINLVGDAVRDILDPRLRNV